MPQTTTDITIIDTLKSELDGKLNRANSYDTDVSEVKIGSFDWEDMKIKPSIAFNTFEEEIEKHMLGNTYIRKLIFIIDLFMDYQPGFDGHEELLKFKNDVESFLTKSTDWTYRADTVLISSTQYFGVKNDNALQAQIQFFVRYKR